MVVFSKSRQIIAGKIYYYIVSFNVLVYSINGGMGPEAARYCKLLCDKISYKTKQKYTDVMNFYRCKLSFLIRRLALLCIRGSRAVNINKITDIKDDDFQFLCFESKLM